jgi:hypothetical protein
VALIPPRALNIVMCVVEEIQVHIALQMSLDDSDEQPPWIIDTMCILCHA